MQLTIATDPVTGAQLAREAARYGHEVLAQVATYTELSAALARAQPAVALIAGSPDLLTAGLLAECDSRGIRIIVLLSTASERRHASSLGLFEFVDAAAPWTEIDHVILGSTGVVRGRDPERAPEPVDRTGGGGIEEPRPRRGRTPRSAVSHGRRLFSKSGPTKSAVPPDQPLPVDSEPHRGTVITVWGPAGAPGRTTIAIGIAVELAAAGYRVALADVDTHGATIAPSLGIMDESPGFAAACRLAGADSLTTAELERLGQQYVVGDHSLWVLTGIAKPSRWPELSTERVTAALAACRDWVDFTVVDTASSLETDEEIMSDLYAPRRNAATITAVREADHVITVGAADPVGISQFLRSHSELVELAETSVITVVMNKLRASATGFNPAGQVTQTLARFGGIQSPVLVPLDVAGVDAAILSGKPLAIVAPKSQARTAIRELVRSRILGSREVPVAAFRPRRARASAERLA